MTESNQPSNLPGIEEGHSNEAVGGEDGEQGISIGFVGQFLEAEVASAEFSGGLVERDISGAVYQLVEDDIELPLIGSEQEVNAATPNFYIANENLDLDPEHGEGDSEFGISLFSNDGHILPRGQLDSLHHVCPAHLETVQALEIFQQFFHQLEEEAELAREAAAAAARQSPQGNQEESTDKKKTKEAKK